MSSFQRAVRSLKRKGLFRETQWTNVLEVTTSGNQALRALKDGPQRALLDLRMCAKKEETTRASTIGVRAGRSPASRRSAPVQARTGALRPG